MTFCLSFSGSKVEKMLLVVCWGSWGFEIHCCWMLDCALSPSSRVRQQPVRVHSVGRTTMIVLLLFMTVHEVVVSCSKKMRWNNLSRCVGNCSEVMVRTIIEVIFAGWVKRKHRMQLDSVQISTQPRTLCSFGGRWIILRAVFVTLGLSQSHNCVVTAQRTTIKD